MPQVEDQRKRQQMNSPEKQQGVRGHDKKRRHVSNQRTTSDMEESEAETQSPAPLTIPPPPNMAQLSIASSTPRDADGDSTMVGQTPPGTPTMSDPGDGDYPSGAPDTPTPAGRPDPVWIVKRTRKSPENPPFTQGAPANPSPTPPQLPKALVRTPAPVGGFPVIHLSTPPWFNLLPEQRTIFDTYPGPKLWIRDWQASKATDLMATSDKLKELLKQMTGERARLSTPQQEKELSSRVRNIKQNPPYHFLISGISQRANEILLAHPTISTPEASAFILPYVPPLPRFLCTIEGFTLSIRNQDAIREAEDMATTIVRKTLSESETLVSLLKSKLVDDSTSQHNLDPAKDILLALEVKLAKGEETVERSATSKPKKPLWNIYFKRPPPLTWTGYFIVLQCVREIKFIDMDCGSATLVEKDNRLHCFNCKGADHNPTQCSFTTVDGWYGNKAEERIEETAEFATSNRGGRTHTSSGNRNDRRADNWRGGGRGWSRGRRL